MKQLLSSGFRSVLRPEYGDVAAAAQSERRYG